MQAWNSLLCFTPFLKLEVHHNWLWFRIKHYHKRERDDRGNLLLSIFRVDVDRKVRVVEVRLNDAMVLCPQFCGCTSSSYISCWRTGCEP